MCCRGKVSYSSTLTELYLRLRITDRYVSQMEVKRIALYCCGDP